jgi:arabinofuranosyltransferase
VNSKGEKSVDNIVGSKIHRMIILATFVITVIMLAGHSWSLRSWTVDDAFITFRYSLNFSEGIGPVYNPGERVEGYSTFLWMLILAMSHTCGADIVLTAKCLGFTFALACFVLLANAHHFVDKKNHRFSCAALVSLGFGATMFSANALSGMETVMTAFWILLSVLMHQKGRQERSFGIYSLGASMSCVLAALSRPDAVLIFLILFTDRFWLSIRQRNWAFFWFGFAFSAVFLPYFAWRYWYYGWLLPNTFYAKVGHSMAQIVRGGEYIMDFMCVLFPPLCFLLVNIFRGAAPGLRCSGAIVLGYIVYLLYVGGDALPAYRLLVPIVPLICLHAADCMTDLLEKRWRICVALIAISVYGITMSFIDPNISKRIINDKVADHGREVGEWMRENAPGNVLVATNTAGSIAYYSGLPVLDTLGLNDEIIAHTDMPSMGRGYPGHEKGNGKYVLSRVPYWIQFGSARGSQKPVFPGDNEIAGLQNFSKMYEFKTFRLPSGMNFWLYQKKNESNW